MAGQSQERGREALVRRAILCVALLVCVQAGGWCQDFVIPIGSGSNRQEARASASITAALAFLEECDSSYHASLEHKYLTGQLHWYESTSCAGYSDNEIYIDQDYLGRDLDFSNPAHLPFIAALARTLVHEARHTDSQTRVYRFGSYMSERSMPKSASIYVPFYGWVKLLKWKNGCEIDAYSATIIEIDHWINCRLKLARGWLSLGEVEAARHFYCQIRELTNFKIDYIRNVETLNTRSGGKFPLAVTHPTTGLPVSFGEYVLALERIRDKNETEKPDPPPPPPPPPTKKPVTTGGGKKKTKEENKKAKSLGGPAEYKTELVEPPAGSKPGEVKYVWKGRGKTTGDVLELVAENLTDRPGEVQLMPGLVLKPPAGGTFQPIMLAEPVYLEIPARGKVSSVIPGFCLKRAAPPPPQNQVIEYDWDWNIPEHSQQIWTLLHAHALADQGKLHNDLGDSHLETVIQRVLWDIDEPGTAGVEVLKSEISRQVKESGGSQSPDEVEKLAENLSADVDLVKKEVSKCPTLPDRSHCAACF